MTSEFPGAQIGANWFADKGDPSMAKKPLQTAEEVLQAMHALPFLEQVQLLFLLRQRAPAPILNSLRMTDHLLRDFFEREAERCKGPRAKATRRERRNQVLHTVLTELKMRPKEAYRHMVREHDDLMRTGQTVIFQDTMERDYANWKSQRLPGPNAK